MRISLNTWAQSIGRVVIAGAAAATLAACKTTSSETTGSISGEPGVVRIADTSIVTGSISQDPQAGTASKSGTLTAGQEKTPSLVPPPIPGAKPVKTVALGGAPTATVKRARKVGDKLSLVFPKNSYTLSSDQSDDLSALVQKAKASKRKVKVIGIARSGKGKKQAKARLAANRRAKAASMFLRVHGLEAKDMIITTADERRSRRRNTNRVDIFLQ